MSRTDKPPPQRIREPFLLAFIVLQVRGQIKETFARRTVVSCGKAICPGKQVVPAVRAQPVVQQSEARGRDEATGVGYRCPNRGMRGTGKSTPQRQ